jgi:hypothetical protein
MSVVGLNHHHFEHTYICAIMKIKIIDSFEMNLEISHFYLNTLLGAMYA